jgi:hypothetical protein
MRINTQIKAVVFDLDGVYFESGTQNFVASMKDIYGLTQRQIEDVYFIDVLTFAGVGLPYRLWYLGI